MTNEVYDDDFLWGASTAAHQVEGGTHNQWSVWEASRAKHLAQTAAKRLGRLPSWPQIKDQATDPQNYISGHGVDHYNLYKDDFALLQSLNMNAFRFSIEWSRLEPAPGQWDEAAIRHYKAYIGELKRRGIKPVLTLWHWTVPVWFGKKGGFEKRQNLHYFYRYAAKVVELYGDDVEYVITINEPTVYGYFSYMSGEWPPQQKGVVQGNRVMRNLVAVHNHLYDALKAQAPHLKIGLAHQLPDVRPLKPNVLNRLVVKGYEYFAVWRLPNKVRTKQDFFALNYYFTEYRDWRCRLRNPVVPTSDLGWYMEPSGIGRLMRRVWAKYRLPIIVTENGLADATDGHRQWWLEESLAALRAAQTEGVIVQGYLHWSFLDNFEWAYGWWPQFGLVHVDRATMRRTVRPSAHWFAAEIKKARQSSDKNA